MDIAMDLEMDKSYDTAKKTIENSEDIKIYSHNDCDGICAGSILSTVLDRLGKEHEKEFVPLDKLENLKIEHELTIFSDLGSGQYIDKLAKKSSKIIILDHHPPIRDLNYKNSVDYDFNEINPLHYGIDGTHYISGGGLSYFLAKKFGYEDLSWIGILSAIGDMQNSRTGKLEGLNKIILQDSVNQEQIKVTNDLSFYGRQTRPIFVALSYFGDIKLPITNSTKETIALMKELDIERKKDGKFRTLSDLTNEEKQKLFRELITMLSKEVPGKYIKYIPQLLVADSYQFLNEKEKTFLSDASEFSTGINACSRNNRDDIACEVLKWDKYKIFNEMKKVLNEHRTYLSEIKNKIEKLKEDKDESIIDAMQKVLEGHGTYLSETMNKFEKLKGDRYKLLEEMKEILNNYKTYLTKNILKFEKNITKLEKLKENRCKLFKELKKVLKIHSKYVDKTIDKFKELKGDRYKLLEEMEEVLKTHKTYLAETISKFEKDYYMVEDENIQYFDGTGIKSNLVGTIAGMVLSQSNWKKPIIGFTQIGDDNPDIKISLRCSRLLAYDGTHYGNILQEVAKSVGGNGGGHSVACGAYIPHNKKEEFFKTLNGTLDELNEENLNDPKELK